MRFTNFLWIFFIIIAFSAKSSFADQQRVVLLTSIDTRILEKKAEKFSCNLPTHNNYVEKLEQLFIDEFSSKKYVLEVVHNADQFDLWTALHDPKNIAIFWISHMGFSPSSNAMGALGGTHVMVDAQGFDVKPIFEKIHPNLRFLAVIGCFSTQVMKTVPTVSHDINHPYLRKMTFDKKIDAKKALIMAMIESKKVLEIPEIRFGYSSPCRKENGFHVKMTRKFTLPESIMQKRIGVSALHPAARIMAGPEVLDVFPKERIHDQGEDLIQEREVFIPVDTANLPTLRVDVGTNFKLELDKQRLQLLDIGKFDFVVHGNNQLDLEPWTVWQTANRIKPIGIFSHIYNVNPSIPIHASAYLTEGSEFQCEAMPAYD